MAYEPICICAETGAGKSTLILDCDPLTTYVLSYSKESLPFDKFEEMFPLEPTAKNPQNRRNFRTFDNAEDLTKKLKLIKDNKPEITTIIIDDIGHLIMSSTTDPAFVAKKNGGEARQKYMDIAAQWANTFIFNPAARRELVNPHTQLVFNWHAETAWTPDGTTYQGVKMFGNVIKPAEYFNTMLFLGVSQAEEDEDKLVRNIYTRPYKKYLQAKSPSGVFKDFPNGVIQLMDLDDDSNDPKSFKGLNWLIQKIHRKI